MHQIYPKMTISAFSNCFGSRRESLYKVNLVTAGIFSYMSRCRMAGLTVRALWNLRLAENAFSPPHRTSGARSTLGTPSRHLIGGRMLHTQNAPLVAWRYWRPLTRSTLRTPINLIKHYDQIIVSNVLRQRITTRYFDRVYYHWDREPRQFSINGL